MTAPAEAVYEVQGHQVRMPVEVRDASAGTVMFDVDAAGAQALLPGEAFAVVETAPGRAQLNVAVIDYRDNDLGAYHEIGIVLFVAPRRSDLRGDPSAAGTFITHLPVDQSFTCDAGRRIWGFPKTVEDISMDHAPAQVTASLTMGGRHVLRLTLPRGGEDEMPLIPMTTYSYVDRRPHATAFSQGGQGSQVVPGSEGVGLELGDHPLARTLADLGLRAEAVQMTTWTEHMQGHFDTPRPL